MVSSTAPTAVHSNSWG